MVFDKSGKSVHFSEELRNNELRNYIFKGERASLAAKKLFKIDKKLKEIT